MQDTSFELWSEGCYGTASIPTGEEELKPGWQQNPPTVELQLWQMQAFGGEQNTLCPWTRCRCGRFLQGTGFENRLNPGAKCKLRHGLDASPLTSAPSHVSTEERTARLRGPIAQRYSEPRTTCFRHPLQGHRPPTAPLKSTPASAGPLPGCKLSLQSQDQPSSLPGFIFRQNLILGAKASW